MEGKVDGDSGGHFRIVRPRLVVGDVDDDIDREVMSFMVKYDLPQGAVAILSGDGRLVYARGFSNFDFFKSRGIESSFTCTLPHQAFRIASLSKPITATAMFMLMEEGKVDLEDYFIDHLQFTELLDHDPTHPRLRRGRNPLRPLPPIVPIPSGTSTDIVEEFPLGKVTIQDLLRHTSGWCEQSGECSSDCASCSSWDGAADKTVKAAFPGVSYPLSTETKIYHAFQPNGFPNNNRAPIFVSPESIAGSSSAWRYSNLGYNLLGRVIEDVTNTSYTRWVHENILMPLGMNSTYPGATALDDVGPMEPTYYYNGPGTFGWQTTATSVLDPSGTLLFLPYGGRFNLSNRRANGGRVSTVVDYARFLGDLRQNSESALLSSYSINKMFSDTSISNRNYAHGWAHAGNYRLTGAAAVSWNGIKEGSETEFVLFTEEGGGLPVWKNSALVAFFSGDLMKQSAPERLNTVLGPKLKQVHNWGEGDLFSFFS